jgi:hypothetical protein
MVSILRRTRLRAEIESLHEAREVLVRKVRAMADRYSDPDKPRIFSDKDFAISADTKSNKE